MAYKDPIAQLMGNGGVESAPPPLPIAALKQTLKGLEKQRDQHEHWLGYHTGEMMKERAAFESLVDQITGLTATIALLEKV